MISILCPTRGRPQLAKRMVDSAYATATGEIEILLFVDDDDDKQKEYFDTSNLHSLISCGSFKNLGIVWNVLAKKCSGNYLMMANDDIIFRTNDWDGILKEKTAKYRDDIYVAHFNSLIKNPNVCSHPIVSRKWYEILGYFTPEIFDYFYPDTWIYDIGKKINRECYIKDVIVEHMHFTQKKSIKDDTYKNNRIRNKKQHISDNALFKKSENTRDKHAELLKSYTI